VRKGNQMTLAVVREDDRGRAIAVPAGKLNDEVRRFWDQSPCGVSREVTGNLVVGSREWFEAVENFRYTHEPFIHSVAQFTRHRGSKLLEVGVGAGTDHLQWARAGADCYGVDLTETAIQLTDQRLRLYGFRSQLQQVDAEELPFGRDTFDLVYSWGVIHHSESPTRIIAEIHRVLKPGGQFIGMMYGRHSLKVFTGWLYWALLRGKPWLSFRDVLWRHVESPGTKAYALQELKELFSCFQSFSAQPILTRYDTRVWPDWLSRFFPQEWGWFIALKAVK
jgi:ubiquinone/menaquinone biosynthesis C-methylase UbiE